MAGLRIRGIDVFVDTTRVAELDIALHGVSDNDLETIVRSVELIPLADGDRFRGEFQIRRIGRWDVGYVQAREGDALIITLGVIEPASGEQSLDQALRKIALIATLRGASGL